MENYRQQLEHENKIMLSKFRLVHMNSIFSPYVYVRIRQLLQEEQAYDGWRINEHSPMVGDYGTVVDVLRAAGLPDKYVVECCQADGSTLWLAEFFAEELEINPTELA